jgi:chromosome segregation ATPase
VDVSSAAVAAPTPAPVPAPAPKAPQLKIPIRFPRKSDGPTLSLPRRRSTLSDPGKAQALADASDEARRNIERIVSATKAPWGGPVAFSNEQAAAMEKALRELESKVEEREHLVLELETRLADRERDLAEAEALLAARERVLDAARNASDSHLHSAPVTNAERSALEALKAELDRQEKSLLEQKNTIAEREHFLDENENKLFEKMQAQQELETQLEQKAEELAAKESRLRNAEAAVASKAAAPKVWDEFKE